MHDQDREERVPILDNRSWAFKLCFWKTEEREKREEKSYFSVRNDDPPRCMGKYFTLLCLVQIPLKFKQTIEREEGRKNINPGASLSRARKSPLRV